MYWDQEVYKKPEKPRRVPWHQDNGYTYIEPQQYLTIWLALTDATEEMGQLIDDLLAFSRVGRAEIRRASVQLGELVQDVIRSLEMAIKDRPIVWQIAPLPTVVGDPSLLKQVLTNLIDNAVKYTRTCEPATIEIGCAVRFVPCGRPRHRYWRAHLSPSPFGADG